MATAQSPVEAPAVGYAPSMDFFKAALRKAQRDALMVPTPLAEKQEIRVRPGFPTACWNFANSTHYIFVGDKLFDKPNIRPNLDAQLMEEYVAVHLHHELGHAWDTSKDLNALNRLLTAHKIPFSLFNFFEDARIEHRYRTKLDYLFGWLRFETLEVTLDPLNLFFALIQSEGDVGLVREKALAYQAAEKAKLTDDAVTSSEVLNTLIASKASDVANPFERVLDYYEKAIKVPTSIALIPLMRAWLKEFPNPPPKQNEGGKAGSGSGGGGAGMQDMSESMQMAATPGALEEALQSSQGLTSIPSDAGGKDVGPADGVQLAEAKNAQVLADESAIEPSDEVPRATAQAVAARLLPLFRARVRKVSTTMPQRKVSMKHLAQGRPPFRKKQTEVRKAKNLLVVVDCSGSMGGFPMEEGKKLLAALSVLASQNLVTGHVVFSGVKGQSAIWERYALPLSRTTVARAKGRYGAEGLQDALMANLVQAKKADHVLVYTDASICDAPIDKTLLHRQGVYTWGVYCGAQDARTLDALQVHFDKALMRPTVEALVDAIVGQI